MHSLHEQFGLEIETLRPEPYEEITYEHFYYLFKNSDFIYLLEKYMEMTREKYLMEFNDDQQLSWTKRLRKNILKLTFFVLNYHARNIVLSISNHQFNKVILLKILETYTRH